MIRTEQEFMDRLNGVLAYSDNIDAKSTATQEMKQFATGVFDVIEEPEQLDYGRVSGAEPEYLPTRLLIRYREKDEWHSFRVTIEHFHGKGRNPNLIRMSDEQKSLCDFWESRADAFDKDTEESMSGEDETSRNTPS